MYKHTHTHKPYYQKDNNNDLCVTRPHTAATSPSFSLLTNPCAIEISISPLNKSPKVM